MEKEKQTKLTTILWAAVCIALGIVFCFSRAMATNIISIIIGIGLILIGSYLIIRNFVVHKTFAAASSLTGGILLAFGIFFIEQKLVSQLLAYTPWALIVIGALFILDAIVRKFGTMRIKTVLFVVTLVLGIILLTLGLLLKFVDSFKDFAAIILGASMIVYGLFVFFDLVFNKKKAN